MLLAGEEMELTKSAQVMGQHLQVPVQSSGTKAAGDSAVLWKAWSPQSAGQVLCFWDIASLCSECGI